MADSDSLKKVQKNHFSKVLTWVSNFCKIVSIVVASHLDNDIMLVSNSHIELFRLKEEGKQNANLFILGIWLYFSRGFET